MPKKPPKLRPALVRLKPAPDRLVAKSSWRTGVSSSTARGYGYQWQMERAEYIALNPCCVMCHERGVLEPATVVDHIKPHRGNMVLFWDRTNWQSLCSTCHSKHKQRIENAQ